MMLMLKIMHLHNALKDVNDEIFHQHNELEDVKKSADCAIDQLQGEVTDLENKIHKFEYGNTLCHHKVPCHNSHSPSQSHSHHVSSHTSHATSPMLVDQGISPSQSSAPPPFD